MFIDHVTGRYSSTFGSVRPSIRLGLLDLHLCFTLCTHHEEVDIRAQLAECSKTPRYMEYNPRSLCVCQQSVVIGVRLIEF